MVHLGPFREELILGRPWARVGPFLVHLGTPWHGIFAKGGRGGTGPDNNCALSLIPVVRNYLNQIFANALNLEGGDSSDRSYWCTLLDSGVKFWLAKEAIANALVLK